MKKRTKKENTAHYVSAFQDLFACPVCRSQMEVSELKSLVCRNNHSFDFAKQGYVNLLQQAPKTKYSRDLFEARRTMMAEEGLFDPLTDALAEWLERQENLRSGPVMMLDTGCGEGSHLARILGLLKESGRDAAGAGIDIAKEGIAEAAKHYPEVIWTVADLAHTPFRDEQFDVLLNILSPSNYAEFSRLLKPGGYLIKVVPGSGYLKELRHAFFTDTESASYDNTETVQRFEERFRMIDRLPVQYTKELSQESRHSLMNMTPLAWTASEEERKDFIKSNENNMTIDLEILIGIK